MDYWTAFVPKSEINKWTLYSNQSATSRGMGTTVYPRFVPLTTLEVQRFLGLEFANGLAPKRNAYHWLTTSDADPLSGNSAVAACFGPDPIGRFKEFKKAFSICRPVGDERRAKEADRIFKVREFSELLQNISRRLWDIGIWFSIDEWDVGFQGKDGDKMKIAFKDEGDGYLADVLAQAAYALGWIFRHADKTTDQEDFSALHNRCFKLFEHLPHHYHQGWVDNLYTTHKFFRHAYIEHKVLLTGVARKNQVPDILQMEKAKTVAELAERKGSVKCARLLYDVRAPDLVGVTVYDSVPVRFLSYSLTELVWNKMSRKVWNSVMQQYDYLKFWRLNINCECKTALLNCPVELN